MSLSEETRAFLSRLNFRANANKREVAKVLEKAKQVRLKCARDERETSEEEKRSQWGARTAEEKKVAAKVTERRQEYKAPRRVVKQTNQDQLDKNMHRPSRKQASVIFREMEEEKRKVVQAPLVRSKVRGNREIEKTKLQLQFQFKGGKALPDAGLPEKMQGEIPMHLISKTAPRCRKQREGSENNKDEYKASRERIERLEKDFEQVCKEIESKRSVLAKTKTAKGIADVRAELVKLIDEQKTIDELIEAERANMR